MKGIVGFMAIVLIGALQLASSSAKANDAVIAEYLTLIQYPDWLKSALRDIVQDRSPDKVEEAILKLPDYVIVESLVPIYRDLLNESEVRQLVQFFRTDTGQLMLETVHKSDQDYTRLPFNEEQAEEYDAFTKSEGGKAWERIASMNDRRIDAEYRAIQQAAIRYFNIQQD